MDDEDFKLEMSKNFISAKIKNQIVVVRRLYRNREGLDESKIKKLKESINRVGKAKSISEIEGIEGMSARIYFSLLKPLIPEKFGFNKRTKNPPEDCFSAVISYLYTLLYNDIVSAIQNAGLNPNIGIMHKLKDSHYALASDIMEEYRALICDCTAVRLFSGKLCLNDFKMNENGSVYLKPSSLKIVVQAYEKRISDKAGYTKKSGTGTDYKSSFSTQIYELIESMNTVDANRYKPIAAR